MKRFDIQEGCKCKATFWIKLIVWTQEYQRIIFCLSNLEKLNLIWGKLELLKSKPKPKLIARNTALNCNTLSRARKTNFSKLLFEFTSANTELPFMLCVGYPERRQRKWNCVWLRQMLWKIFFRIFNRRHVTLIVSFPFCSWRARNKMVMQCLCRGVPHLIFDKHCSNGPGIYWYISSLVRYHGYLPWNHCINIICCNGLEDLEFIVWAWYLLMAYEIFYIYWLLVIHASGFKSPHGPHEDK